MSTPAVSVPVCADICSEYFAFAVILLLLPPVSKERERPESSTPHSVDGSQLTQEAVINGTLKLPSPPVPSANTVSGIINDTAVTNAVTTADNPLPQCHSVL